MAFIFKAPGASARASAFRAPSFPSGGGNTSGGAAGSGPSGPPGPPGPGRQVSSETVDDDAVIDAVAGEHTVEVAHAADVSITLPTEEKPDQIVVVRDRDGAAGRYPITVTAESPATINGAESLTFDADYGVARIERTSGGDWVCFNDPRNHRGVEVGRYLSDSDSIASRFTLALARNPNAKYFYLPTPPQGVWDMTQMAEAQGLRSNLVIDGGHNLRCELKRTTVGQMFLWASSVSNVAVRNLTLNFENINAPFSTSITAPLADNFTVEDCRLLCTIPNTATGDGIRHQVTLAGSRISFLRNYCYRAQLRGCSPGYSTNGARWLDNEFEDCNDLGVSCVAGDGASPETIKNILISRNRFFGTMIGSGAIYVGSDAVTTNPALLSDVMISDNIVNVALGQAGTDGSRPAGRLGIYVVCCDVNKRISMVRNFVTNSNPSYSTPIVFGMAYFIRNGTSTSSTDVRLDDNAIDFRSDDTRMAILVDAPAMKNLRVCRNTAQPGSRGFDIEAGADAKIEDNYVDGSGALTLRSGRSVVTGASVRRNTFKASGSFASSVQISGTNNQSRVAIEHNRLVTATGSSVVNSLTGGATFGCRYNYNSHTAGLSGTVTPTATATGNVTEAE